MTSCLLCDAARAEQIADEAWRRAGANNAPGITTFTNDERRFER